MPITTALFATAVLLSADAPPLPEGPRIKELTSTPIGVFLPPDRLLGSDPRFAAVVEREFNAIQCADWPPNLWPADGQFKLDGFNASVDWARKRGMTVMAFPLMGRNFGLPDWLRRKSWSNDELRRLLRDAVGKMIEVNGNAEKVLTWTVMNEGLDDRDGRYRPLDGDTTGSLWGQLGEEDDRSGLTGEAKVNAKHPIYFRLCFEYAKAAGGRRLQYRDYGVETLDTAKGKALYQLACHLKNSGTPIDSVGFQCHWDKGRIYDDAWWGSYRKTIQAYREIGVAVDVTELDYGIGPENPLGAAGAVATASGVEKDDPAYAAQHVLDGDGMTRWASPFSEPHWLAIDLGSPRPIQRVELHWEWAAAAVWTLEGSLDGTTWTTLRHQDAGTGAIEVIDGLSATVRHLRLQCRKRSGPHGFSLYEVLVDPVPGKKGRHQLERQAEVFRRTIAESLSAGVEQIFFWGLTDESDKGWRYGESCYLLNADFTLKPAWLGLQRGIAGK